MSEPLPDFAKEPAMLSAIVIKSEGFLAINY